MEEEGESRRRRGKDWEKLDRGRGALQFYTLYFDTNAKYFDTNAKCFDTNAKYFDKNTKYLDKNAKYFDTDAKYMDTYQADTATVHQQPSSLLNTLISK